MSASNQNNITYAPAEWVQQYSILKKYALLWEIKFKTASNIEIYQLKRNKVFIPTTELLQALAAALKQPNEYNIQQVKKLAATQLPKTILQQPSTQQINTQSPIIAFYGQSAIGTTMQIIANGKVKAECIVNQEGKFNFGQIHFDFGQYKVQIHNALIGFLQAPIQLQININKHLHFLGQYDPLQQKHFESDEIDEIVRCKECLTYQYNDSIQAMDGKCTICKHNQFYESNEAEFFTDAKVLKN